MDALCTKSATELADLIKKNETSSKEVVEAHLNRISEINPEVNAICLLYTSPSPRDRSLSRMPSSA